MSDAANAQATADGKATVYTGDATPSLPSEGDLWLKSKNDGILTYVNGSWVTYNKYTDNTVANEAKAIANSAVGSVNVQYYLSNKTTALEGGEWKDTAPE